VRDDEPFKVLPREGEGWVGVSGVWEIGFECRTPSPNPSPLGRGAKREALNAGHS